MDYTYENFSGEWQQCGDKMIRAIAYVNFNYVEHGYNRTKQMSALSQINDRVPCVSYLMAEYEALGADLCKA